MRVRLKGQLLIITAEADDERQGLAAWAGAVDGHVFALVLQDAQTVRLTSLGPRADACREPINVTSRAADPAVRLISNLAHTPFELHGRGYASVEGFWQGLKFADEHRRMEVAALHGQEARLAGVRRAPRSGLCVSRQRCPERDAGTLAVDASGV